MEYERITSADGHSELWVYEWDLSQRPPTKVNRSKLGIEQPPSLAVPNFHSDEAISWSYGRTLGSIATVNDELIRSFPDSEGSAAILNCEIVPAGKFQNGMDRWWCRTHQKHWGVLADVADATAVGMLRCAQRTQPMWYVINPYKLSVEDHAEVGVWCSLPAALSNRGVPPGRHPRLHVHVRDLENGPKVADQDFNALTLMFDSNHQLLGANKIDRVHLSPPAAKDFMLALEFGKSVTCFNCNYCDSPHLDLGEFVNSPHRKHLCGNCGRDSTWSQSPSASTPLKPLHDYFDKGYGFHDVDSVINLDQYPNAEFAIWASTPAIIWTASRPQERGIHVHLSIDGRRIIDNTFGTVIYQGQNLDRKKLLAEMIKNTFDN
jgi:transposase-like protein